MDDLAPVHAAPSWHPYLVRSLPIVLLLACSQPATRPAQTAERSVPETRPETPPDALSLRPPCVVPEEREYIVEIVSREANPPPEREDAHVQRNAIRTLRMDVDGDGVMDALVPTLAPGRCPREVEYAIFVMRGECGHHVGRITGQPSLGDEKHDGLFDIRASRRWSEITDPNAARGPDNVATLHEVTTPWSARGGQYQPGQSDVRESVCHHCAIAQCRTISGPPPREESCDPLPREGDICEGHGVCAIDWGNPGGYSSAFWCRNGRWQIENESNEP